MEGESITTVDSVILNEAINQEVDLDDVDLLIDQDYEGPLKSSVESAIKKKWAEIMGPDVEIVVSINYLQNVQNNCPNVPCMLFIDFCLGIYAEHNVYTYKRLEEKINYSLGWSAQKIWGEQRIRNQFGRYC